MNANRRRKSASSGLGRSTGDAAFRGALLIGVAVIVGVLLLWRAHDDNATAAVGSTDGNPVVTTTTHAPGTTAAPQAPGTTAAPQAPVTTAAGATAAPAATKPPAQVQVLVANGTGTPSGASKVTDKLKPKGYATLSPANATSANTAASKVYYREGYAEDAKAIARDLGVAAPVENIIEPMPAQPPVAATAADRAAKANVLVVIGTDGRIKQ
jgi:hypothetical protein